MVPYLMGQKRMASILSFISLIRLSLVACSVFAHFYGICALIKRRANQQVQASNLSGFEIAPYLYGYRVCTGIFARISFGC